MGVFEELDNLIRGQDSASSAAEHLARLGTPSASVAILEGGKISAHCFSTVGNDPETIFQACSISKPTAGTAVMKLVDQGKFQLDSRIGDLLPRDVLDILSEEASPARKAMVQGVTIRQLLSHTSGLSQGGFPGYGVAGDAVVPTPREVLAGKYPANTPRVQLQGFPGESFSYAGGGITVLQLVVETVTGRDFASLMQELMFQPLGMTRSSYLPLSGDEKNAAVSHWTGCTPSEDAQRVNPEQAAAGLWTTPSDLLKLVSAVQDSLQSDEDNGFVRRDTARQMLTKVDQDMALSWFVPGDAGTTFTHAGSNYPGFRCHVAGYADILGRGEGANVPRNCGVSVMTNSFNGDTTIWRIVQAVAYLKGWPEIPRTYGYAQGIVPFVAAGEEPGQGWKDWIGTWADERPRRRLLRIEAGSGGRPFLRYGDLPPVALLPAAMPGAKAEGIDGFASFVVEELAMMACLELDGGERTVRLVNGANEKISRWRRA